MYPRQPASAPRDPDVKTNNPKPIRITKRWIQPREIVGFFRIQRFVAMEFIERT
jgi:hypothetical protein